MRRMIALFAVALAALVVWTWGAMSPRTRTITVESIESAPGEPREQSRLESVESAAVANAAVHAVVPDASEPTSARVVVLESGATEFVEFEAIVVCPTGVDCARTTVYASLRKPSDGVWKPDGSFDEKRTDSYGRAHLKLPKRSDEVSLVLWADSDGGSLASQPRIFADARAIPAEVTLVLEPAVELRVAVLDADGNTARKAQIDVVRTDGLPYENTSDTSAGENGETTLRLPRGQYELVASDFATQAVARTTVFAREDGRVTLHFPFVPLAISGVVLDESGNGLARITLTVEAPQARVGPSGYTGPDPPKSSNGFGLNASTDAAGKFEARFEPCGAVDVSISFDPLLASFSPPTLRVPHGTTDVVIRRERTWTASGVRIHALDATTKAVIGKPTLTLRLVPERGGKRVFNGHDGWVEVALPERDDLAWKVDGFGYFPIEGTIESLRSRLKNGVLELELAPDPAEVQPPKTKRAPDTASLPKSKGLRLKKRE